MLYLSDFKGKLAFHDQAIFKSYKGVEESLQFFLFSRKNKSFSMTKLLEHSVTQPTANNFFLKELAWVKLFFFYLPCGDWRLTVGSKMTEI